MKTPSTLFKKLTVSTLFMSASFVSVLSHADVTLLVDDNIKVTAINGQELKQSLFAPLTKQFTLQPGQHVITAKYDRLYNFPRDEHDYLRSSNISVAADLADNQTYRLTMPGQPEEYEAAKEYSEQPTLAIAQGNTIIASQKSIASNNGGIFSGLGKALGGVFGGSGDAQVQNQNAIAALGQSAAAPAQGALKTGAVVSTTTTAIPAVSTSADTLDQFMQLWLNASPNEREKMRQWIQK